MRRKTFLFATIISFIFSQNTYAQGFSAGVRTGVGNTFDIKQFGKTIHTLHIDKEVFMRYETNVRWAFEINANQYNYRDDHYYEVYDILPWQQALRDDSQPIAFKTRYNTIDLGFSAQYSITPNGLQDKCPLFRKLKNYIGVHTGVQYMTSKSVRTSLQYPDGNITEYAINGGGLDYINIGLSHTLTYTINKVYLTSIAGFNINTMKAGGLSAATLPPENNSNFSLRFGIGHKL